MKVSRAISLIANTGEAVLNARVKTMRGRSRRWSMVLGLGLSVVGLAGCERLFNERGDRALSKAREKEKEGDYRAAVQWYETALDGTEQTAEAHYDMALIYDDKLNEPVAALDHFNRYIELAPHGAHVKDAKSFASQDEFKLVNTLSKGNFMPQQDAARLKNANLDLQQQVTDARKEIADLRAMVKASLGKNGRMPDAAQKPIPAGARTYTVESGDTLRSISRKFFKSPNHWQNIQDANFNTLSGNVKLKVGMVLYIPAK